MNSAQTRSSDLPPIFILEDSCSIERRHIDEQCEVGNKEGEQRKPAPLVRLTAMPRGLYTWESGVVSVIESYFIDHNCSRCQGVSMESQWPPAVRQVKLSSCSETLESIQSTKYITAEMMT